MQEYGSMAYKRTEVDVEKQLLVTLTYLGTVQSYKYLYYYPKLITFCMFYIVHFI